MTTLHARRSTFSKAGAVLAAIVVAITASPAAVRAQQKARALDTLERNLTALVSQPDVDHALWAVRVVSLPDGEPVFTYNGRRLMVPASNQKLLTAAVAVERLGWDYRFTTRLMTAGTVDAEGTLHGNVYVVGDGDPSINPRVPERWRAFDDWADTLARSGVRVIDGHLVGDDDLVDEPGWGAGWSWDDLQFGYGAASGALQYNENQVAVTVGPGMRSGGDAVITLDPAGSNLLVDAEVVTSPRGSEPRIELFRLPGTRFLEVRGQVPLGASPVRSTVAVDNPTSLYLNALAGALSRHGIFLGGSATDIDELVEPHPDPASMRTLVTDRSPPLSELVDVMLKWSRNGYAESLLAALGRAAPRPYDAGQPGLDEDADTQPSTFERGLAVVASTLAHWDVDESGYLARDGSGLSRMDYVSADTLATVLTRMWQDPPSREVFRLALPQAGISGTLAWRLGGTRAEGRVWAKTGTLSNVRALSGYVETRAGEPLAFSILVNNFIVPSRDIDAIVDRMLLQLIDLPRR